MSKMVVDGRPDHFLGVFGWPLIQVDMQFDQSVRRKFLRPAYDEFFRVVVEIFFDKWRRVHRIEELVCVAQFQAYGVRVCPVLRGGVRERKTHTRSSAIKGSSVETRLANNKEVGIGRKVYPKRLAVAQHWGLRAYRIVLTFPSCSADLSDSSRLYPLSEARHEVPTALIWADSIDGIEYGYGVVVDRGEIRERQNRAKPSHSSRSDYPFSCQPLSLVRQP